MDCMLSTSVQMSCGTSGAQRRQRHEEENVCEENSMPETCDPNESIANENRREEVEGKKERERESITLKTATQSVLSPA